MRRREFITALGSAAAPAILGSLAASAQRPAMPVVGYLGDTSPEAVADNMAGFHRGLGGAGYLEGRSVAIEYRWANGQYDRLPAFAADLVRREVTVIVASATPSALAAKSATTTIPIVFAIGADPTKFGLVASLNRPGGNITGVSWVSNALVQKQLELLRELVPSADTIALLVNPDNPNAQYDVRDAQAGARSLDRSLQILNASTVSEIDATFATLVQQRIGALLLEPDALLGSRGEQLVTLARYHRIPAMYYDRQFTMLGGLISYGARRADSFQEAGAYVGRILKGERPADLPVMQPTKFELVINLKAAKTIGLTVRESFLLRADEVIE
jgi:putative tryptophan/tyrosine transport system substrate-binding protein